MTIRSCFPAVLLLGALVDRFYVEAQGTEPRPPNLAEQLRRRSELDQAARRELLSCGTDEAKRRQLAAAIRSTDQNNVVWLKKIVAKHGWPGKSLVGAEGAQCAWLLVQHADADLEFQELCLEKMKMLPRGEVEPAQVAYLTDRVLVARGEKQKYGTQAAFDGKTLKPFPIEDQANVDRRRRDVGLEPLADYLRALERAYSPPGDSEDLPQGPREP